MVGSEIKVRSTLGEGSVFWFDLDLPEVSGWQEPNQSESRRLVGFKGHKRKVLIVDDNQVNCPILRQMLEPLGFEILEAVDGQDCLNKAVEFQPDQKKGFQASLFKGNYQKNVGFQAPSFQGGANPKSKIVRLNFDRLSYRADSELVELHAEVQNPKSGDLILMDLLMPVLDGFEVIRRLR